MITIALRRMNVINGLSLPTALVNESNNRDGSAPRTNEYHSKGIPWDALETRSIMFIMHYYVHCIFTYAPQPCPYRMCTYGIQLQSHDQQPFWVELAIICAACMVYTLHALIHPYHSLV